MSLEDLIAANTKALEANTAALKAGGTGAASTGSKPAAGTAPKVTLEQIVTVLTEIKEAHGGPAFKEVLRKFGATKSAELKEADYAKVLKAAKDQLTALNAAAEAGGTEEEDEL